ncbi:cation:proton antiporter [Desertivirga brevis]|uniref:cation:proton antiporter n=1 Tax=Desertivirga brevis TaxID=2810310 RepID=UPI001A975613|nr:cation:proton antiporter [Pedobacter sp. SYSU D00873]
MVHLPQLITDLGLILGAAAITTLIFKRIKQPLVLGYILAGFLVGPHFSFIPTVSEEKSIAIWAEIGVIFLLFNLGLEFSFKKLLKVGGAASITAIVEVVFMLLFGFLSGKALGWNTMDSIFLGGILSVSSTTIIIRAFDELGVKHKQFARLVFGILIVEDLVAILLLVLLTTIAVSQNFAGLEMLESILKLGFFLVLWFVSGIFLIPSLLKKVSRFMTDETMLILSLALCLAMVIFATKAGFSPALGAFIMGSILAETVYAEKIEHLTLSVKDLFAAVFFVSVGMLINPQVLVDYAVPILVITVVTVGGKFLSSSLGALLSGQPLKTSVQAGMSLAQIGEFSFIIATLGLTLKVTSDFLYPIAVAVSALTTFTTPYLIKASNSFYGALERNLPNRWIAAINNYSTSTQGITTTSDWEILLKAYVGNFFIQSVILIGIIVLVSRVAMPFVLRHIEQDLLAKSIVFTLSMILMAPFLWSLAAKRIEKRAYSHLWLNTQYSRGPLVALELLRLVFAITFVAFLVTSIFETTIAVIILTGLVVAVLAIFSSRLNSFYNRLENRFVLNFNAREVEQSQNKIIPWDSHLATMQVSANSSFIGRTLIELAIREKYGVNVAMIERGKRVITTPGKDERLFPYDKLTVIGTDEELATLKHLLETEEDEDPKYDYRNNIQLHKVPISSRSPLCNKSIRDSSVREQAQGLLVAVEREGKRILNPESSFILREGDMIWMVGNRAKIESLFF